MTTKLVFFIRYCFNYRSFYKSLSIYMQSYINHFSVGDVDVFVEIPTPLAK